MRTEEINANGTRRDFLNGRLTLEVNRPIRRPDDEGRLEIEEGHWGLDDDSGWVRVERVVRPMKRRENKYQLHRNAIK